MRILLLLFLMACQIHAIGQGNLSDRFVTPLDIPDLVSGEEITLEVDYSTTEFFLGAQTPTLGINGHYLGPVILMEKGDSIRINVTNHMEETTTMHWHGLHVPAKYDGGPRTPIPSGETWSPKFKVLDEAATYWYHPHPHGLTTQQVTLGLMGLIIIQSEEEQALGLPNDYGYDDLPLIVQSKSFRQGNKHIEPLGTETHFLVNSTVYPYCEVPRKLVRLRIMNGSNLRVVNLGFSDNRTFYQIASDGGLLPQPVALQRIVLSTGERAEILVDFEDLVESKPDKVYLKNYVSELPAGTPGTLFTAAPSILDIFDIDVMEFRGLAPQSEPNDVIPAQLSGPWTVWDEEEAAVTRYFNMEVNLLELIFSGFIKGFSFDHQLFDHHVIDHVVQLGDVEIWELYNNTPFSHPFHIHDQQFYILDRNGIPPPENERGRKDVVLVNRFERVRIITRFEDFADDYYTYMYHCHILSHEDEGMMGQFLVVDSSLVTPVQEHYAVQSLTVYPNPAKDGLHVTLDQEHSGPFAYEIYNMNGQLNGFGVLNGHRPIDVSGLTRGEYILQIKSDGNTRGRATFVKL